jgi:uncharacterized protein YciI
MIFAAIIDYTPEKTKITELRPLHREYLAGLKKEGKVVLSGPIVGDSGGIIVYQTETVEETEQLMRNDPFGRGGVFVSWVIRPWNLILVNREFLPA